MPSSYFLQIMTNLTFSLSLLDIILCLCSTSPTTSPTSNSSSPTPANSGSSPVGNQGLSSTAPGCLHTKPITGIPCVAAASRYTAPVHIDVGGTIYTSSLETLTK